MINAKDMFADAEFHDEAEYFKGSLGKKVGTADAKRARNWTAGLAVYNIANPAEPRQICFMPVEDGNVHGLSYTAGQWAYASVLLNGFTDYIFMTINMSDPARPSESGMYWITGMNAAAEGDARGCGARRTRSRIGTSLMVPDVTPVWS